MSDILLGAQNVSKRFPGVLANNDVSVHLKKGRILALLGENGAGKSTLVNILFGMYRPDKGHVIIKGEKVDLLRVVSFPPLVMNRDVYNAFDKQSVPQTR